MNRNNRNQQMCDVLATSASPLGFGARRLTGTVCPAAYVQTRRVRRGVFAEPLSGAWRFVGLLALGVGLLAQPVDAALTLVDDGDARAIANAKWDAAWEQIDAMKRDYPLVVSPAYIQRNFRRLERFNPTRFD